MLSDVLVYRNNEPVSHIREMNINSESGIVSYHTKTLSSVNFGTEQYRIDWICHLKIQGHMIHENKVHLYLTDTPDTTGKFYFEVKCKPSENKI